LIGCGGARIIPGGDSVADEAKTQANQIDEITKLVQDAQDKLDQVVRALRMLEDRVKSAGRGRDARD